MRKKIITIIIILVYVIFPTIILKIIVINNNKVLNKDSIYITFDDGPDKYYTDNILNILYENNIKAGSLFK